MAAGAGPVLEFVDGFDGYTVEWIDEAGVLVSRGPCLYALETVRRPTAKDVLFAVPLGAARRALAALRPAQRLTRSLFYNVSRLADGSVFFTFARQMGVWRNGEIITVTGAQHSMRCLRGAVARTADGTLYMGEYDQNPDRRPMRVYRLAPGADRLEVAYEFAAGAVRHVHGLYVEPTTQRVWCTTGDLERECTISVTDDAFRTLEVVGQGDESWRAVSLAFMGPTIVYGTDAEFVQNAFFALDTRSGERRRLGDADGPVYFSAPLGAGQLFSVTAEAAPSQPVNQASLWYVDGELAPRRLASYAKDAWPRHFMFGTIHFALGPARAQAPSSAYAYLHGLAGVDGKTVRLTA